MMTKGMGRGNGGWVMGNGGDEGDEGESQAEGQGAEEK
ncbi:hypothetical protein NIES37_54040 [Tolypothrix tenuis PCC 7101]|uniref:Uncharacterized protein n=1 Tax=Tolypothrix tenuis PCC 7101 TaxID=231146 RepID=A0A1Z4N6R7_9CYAN|nr:hypothetical protein NIES37_54040 [Tolypothrix tenuis PCC 7101]BAZ74673.1 hypothetical protein NIES50_32510 [Aulosira laxa NIES-50]